VLILAGIVMGAFLMKAIFAMAFRWWSIGYVYDQEAVTTTELLDRYMHAPYWIHLERNSAEFLRTLSDSIGQAYSNVIMGGVSLFTEAFIASSIVIVLIFVQPLAAISAALYFLLAGFLYARFVAKHATEAGKVLNNEALQASKAAIQALGSVKEVKIRNRQGHFVETYGSARVKMAKAKRTSAFLGELPKYLLEVVFIFGVGLLSVIVVSRSTSKDVLALLALFVASGFRLLPSLVKMMWSYSSIKVGRRGFDLVVSDLLAFPSTRQDVTRFNPTPLPLEHTLSVENLTYSYATSKIPVLRNVSFSLPSGESLGIVGLSGAGKSTLVDLILGLHIPDEGRICVDGSDINENMPGWQKGIGLVPQDVYLLDESLTANIAFGIADEEIDIEQVRRAVEQAQLTEFAESLEHGLDSVVGERGMRISGGQRQRIGIARSLYSSPSLLVLDEATSALDNETELRISETIQSLHGSLTMIVVAHRLSTIKNCDRILFLDSGEVQDIGTFDELVDRNPQFANLANLANVGRASHETQVSETEVSETL
jgi:ABC-type multidrug transport system fused ATPase/permease subunit